MERASIAAASCRRVGGAAALATLGQTAFTIGASAQDAVTITMWGNHPEWRDPMLEILAAFEEANPGITVELTAIPGPDYPTKLQTAIAGGAPSDVLGMRGRDASSPRLPPAVSCPSSISPARSTSAG